METDEQTPKALFVDKKNAGRLKTAVLLFAIVLIGLLPIHAFYFAFTRDTPVWLQWLIVTMMCFMSLAAIAASVLTWRTSHKVIRWLDLLSFTLLLCGLLGFMFLTNLPFSNKWSDSMGLFAVPALLSRFFSSRINKPKATRTEREQ